MTSIGGQLMPKTRRFRSGHAIVMTFVAGAALAASAMLASAPAVAPASAPATAMLTACRAPEAPIPVQTLGYVEFDWPGDRDMPGFASLPTDDFSAGAQ